MTNRSPFLKLPPEIRLQVYEYLCPRGLVPAEAYEPFQGQHRDLFGRAKKTAAPPMQGQTNRLLNHPFASLLRTCKEIHGEAQGLVYKYLTFELSGEGINTSKRGETQLSFLSKHLDETDDEISSLPAFKNFRHLQVTLHVDVMHDADDCELQDQLYQLVVLLRARKTKIQTFDAKFKAVRGRCFHQESEAPRELDWAREDWKEFCNLASCLLEPFQNLRNIRSFQLGVVAGCVCGSVQALSLARPSRVEAKDKRVYTPWPTTGKCGAYRKHIEDLMMSDKPVDGMDDLMRFYHETSKFKPEISQNGRFNGNLLGLLAEYKDCLTSGSFQTQNITRLQRDEALAGLGGLKKLAQRCQPHCRRVYQDESSYNI
jgi:hypothetical protein